VVEAREGERGDGLVIMTNGINGAALWRDVVESVDRRPRVLNRKGKMTARVTTIWRRDS
jgi:hypothetical protein